jgi:Tol biopolymer transport system component
MREEPNIRAKVNLVIGESGNRVIAACAIALSVVTLPGAQRVAPLVRSQLVWVDRAGKKLATVGGELADFGDIELSPDRKQIAAAVLNDQTGLRELWLYDAEGRTRTRLRGDATNVAADENWLIWSPDGKRIVYNSQRTGGLDLYGRDLGSTREHLLASDEERGQWPVSWSPDGKTLLVVTNTAGTGNDIWVLPLEGKTKPYPFLASGAQENWAAFSPNGKWVAFSFKEPGEDTELYVTTFPKAGRRYLVSARGGFQARWRRDGKELFFLATNGTLTTSLMVADVDGDGRDFEVRDVKKLFDTSVPYPPYHAFDVSADGQRILINSLLLGPASQRSVRLQADVRLKPDAALDRPAQ